MMRAKEQREKPLIPLSRTHPDTGYRVTARVRRDNPETNKDGKRKTKYWSAFGDRKHFYFPPDTLKRLDDPETAIALVEAENSVLALSDWRDRMKQQILPICMGGCSGHVDKTGKRNNSRHKFHPLIWIEISERHSR